MEAAEAETDVNNMYTTLHEQYRKYKMLFKPKQSSGDAKEDGDITVDFETESKAMLENMQGLVNKALENVEPSETKFPRLLGLKCNLIYEEGRLQAHLGDEELGLKTMTQALELSTNHRLLPELTYLVLKIWNTSAYLESRRGKYEEAYSALEEAKGLYHQVCEQDAADFFVIDDLFSEDEVIKAKSEAKTQLERLMTNNLQMLGYVCNRLGRTEEYFKYNHEVLERQLEDSETEPTLWATKAGRLAFGFMSQTRFMEARHHLAAANQLLQDYEIELKNEEGTEELAEKNEKLQQTYADIAKLWVKYGLYLLSASKKRLISTFYADANDFVENLWLPTKGATEDAAGDEGSLKTTDVQPESPDSQRLSDDAGASSKDKKEEAQSPHADEEPPKGNVEANEVESMNAGEIKVEEEDTSSQCKEDEQKEIPQENLLLFPTLNLDEIENQVTAHLIETTEQARSMVTFAHDWLRRSKIYYNISQHPTEYINAVLDLSDLYRYLAFFEEDVENQYLVQKRRADVLETLNTALQDLRPPCHLTITIELLRELAEVQLELVGLNLRRLFTVKGTYEEGDSELSPSTVLQKMGALADIHGRLEHFGDSFSFVTQGFCEGGPDSVQQCT